MKTWIELDGSELAIMLACATCQDEVSSAMLGKEIVCAKCHNARSGLDWSKILKDNQFYKEHLTCYKCGLSLTCDTCQ